MTENLDRLVADVAAKESDRLLKEAIALAREQVLDELVRRLRPAMLAALSDVDDLGRAEATAGLTPAAETGIYVYGITRDGNVDLSSVPGVGADGDVRVITRHGLGLLVSEIRVSELADLESADPVENGRLATLVRRHDAVVRTAFDQEAVLPMRFGTVLPDEEAATVLLDEQRRQALATLERVAGKCEWGVKVRQATDSPEPDSGTSPAAASTGTEYLARKRDELAVKQAAATRRRGLVDRAHGVLADRAADSIRRSADGALLDGAYLVPDARTDEFLSAVQTLTGELDPHGLRLRATGPWPPYTFAHTGVDDA